MTAYATRQNRARLYGVGQYDYEVLLDNQNGVCAICGAKCKTGKELAVDHDHETGLVRGLLCTKCNTGLGMFNDSIRLLAGAIVYLQDHEKKLKSPR